MKYVGKKRVMNVKKFLLERSGIEILVKSDAFATVSSSGCDFFCKFSIKRKVSPVIRKCNSEFKKLNFDSIFEKLGKKGHIPKEVASAKFT